MLFNITHPQTESEAADIARFQVEMADESEGLKLDPAIVLRGVQMAMEDPSTKGRYFIAKTTEDFEAEPGLIIPQGSVVGSLFVTREWSDWHCEWYWWIQSVYVRPLFRRKGVFKAMHTAVVEQARRANIHEVRLYVEHTNARAQSTYQSVGMHQSHYLLYEQEL